MSLKTTIMEMIEKEIGIEVVDTPRYEGKSTNESLLFIGYENGTKDQLKVINYNEYDLYEREVVIADLMARFVTINGVQYEVIDYENITGVLTIDEDVHKLMPYEDKIDTVSNNNGFILVTSPYSYTKRLNRNRMEYYYRYQFDLFLYDEENNDRLDNIIDKLHKLFSVDFSIDKSNSYAYIQSPLTIKSMEFLNTDKVIRGSILLRTDK